MKLRNWINLAVLLTTFMTGVVMANLLVTIF
jgi:uncharacterized membrane protein YoaK (UPF0700 family)